MGREAQAGASHSSFGPSTEFRLLEEPWSVVDGWAWFPGGSGFVWRGGSLWPQCGEWPQTHRGCRGPAGKLSL